MKCWVGYVNNKAVSVVTVVFAADAVGVYSLGTLPQHQGCGYGETLLRHGLEEARRETGITRSILQATDDGFNLYLRLGYRVVTSFSVYTKETCG
jgi:ribosomal protein S18 acetylase RimI-like enzyme